MRALIQLIVELCRHGRPNASGADPYLKPLVILMIGLLAGPDILVAVELTTMLELFGATLFLLTFLVGFRLLGFAALEWVRKFLLPAEYVVFLKMSGQLSARLYGVFLIARVNCRRALVLYCLCLLACAGTTGGWKL